MMTTMMTTAIRAMISSPQRQMCQRGGRGSVSALGNLFEVALAARAPPPYAARARPPFPGIDAICGRPGTNTMESGENGTIHDDGDGGSGGG